MVVEKKETGCSVFSIHLGQKLENLIVNCSPRKLDTSRRFPSNILEYSGETVLLLVLLM